MFEKTRLMMCGCNRKCMRKVAKACKDICTIMIGDVDVFYCRVDDTLFSIDMRRGSVRVLYTVTSSSTQVSVGLLPDSIDVTNVRGVWDKEARSIVSDVTRVVLDAESKLLQEAALRITKDQR